MIVSKKITSKSVRPWPVFFLKKYLNLIFFLIISNENIRYSGNYMYIWLCSLVLCRGFLIRCADNNLSLLSDFDDMKKKLAFSNNATAAIHKPRKSFKTCTNQVLKISQKSSWIEANALTFWHSCKQLSVICYEL